MCCGFYTLRKEATRMQCQLYCETLLFFIRFGEVAELLDVCWLEIVGRIGSSALSPKTAYAAYLVFKIADDWHGLHCPKQETCVTLGGVESKHTVCLQPDAGTQQIMRGRLRRFRLRGREMPQETMDAGVISPRTRSDGWMEVEMGEFYNETGEDGEVEMSLREIRGGNWKKGLIVQGIEIRPKM